MVGFVQNYAAGSRFIRPENQPIESEGSLLETADKPQSMQSHHIVCFYGEQVEKPPVEAVMPPEAPPKKEVKKSVTV